MLFPLLACAFLRITAAEPSEKFSNVSVKFPKCCPNSYYLMKVTDMFFDVRYECVDREFGKNNYSVLVPPLVLGKNIQVNYGIPGDCEELVMTKVSENAFVENNSCYDRLVIEVVNETLVHNIPQIVSLSCATQENETHSVYDINYLRKCCRSGHTYDMENHGCREADETDSEEWLVSRIDHTGENVHVMDYGLHCKLDEYEVELPESLFSFNFQESTLEAINVDRNIQEIMTRGEWCADRAFGSKDLIVRGCVRNCSEYGAFCVRKCCPIGYHYQPRRCGSDPSVCVPNLDDTTLFNISFYLDPLRDTTDFNSDVFGIRQSLQCPRGKLLLKRENPTDNHYLALSGEMTVSPVFGKSPTNDYCMEIFDRRQCGSGITVETLLCFVDVKRKDFSISFVTICISCVFLFLTLVVYSALSELRNLHGKTLICHVSMMLLAYCCLARVQYDRVDDKRVCKMLGYGIYFGFVAAFSWLNVMCLDIWWTFGSVRTVQVLHKTGAERRRFAWYSLYAWSVTVGLTTTMLLLDMYPVVGVLDADIGKNMCWFGSEQNSSTDWPHYVFFVMPMGLVTTVNFVLWVLTARHCHRVKAEVHRLQAGSAGDRVKRRFRADRARYVLTGKLWVVMGAGWMWELLSTLVTEPRWFWFIFDLINELQGVSIFLILVLKPKLYYLIRKKLGLEKRGAQKNGTSSTARTSSTFLSRTISSDGKALQRLSLQKP